MSIILESDSSSSTSSIGNECMPIESEMTGSLFPIYGSDEPDKRFQQTSAEYLNSTSVDKSSAPTGSLFPAYRSNQAKKQDENLAEEKLEWLTNRSFTPSAAKTAESFASVSKDVATDDKEKLSLDQKRKLDKKGKGEKEETKKAASEVFLPKKTFIEETGLAPEHAFRVDRAKDPENFLYDSFYKTDVSRFIPIVNCPLGLPKNMQEKYLTSNRKLQKRIRSRLAAARYFSKKNVKEYQKATEDVLSNVNKPDVIYNFIPFTLPKPVETPVIDLEPDPLGIYDRATNLYISGVFKAKLEDEKTESIENGFGKSHIIQKTRWFNKNLRENPGDEKMWLEFVQFQDESDLVELYEGENMGGEKRIRLLLERKLAILDRAVSSNPRSIRLTIERLDIGSQLWDWSKVSEEWKKLTFLHAGNPEIWNNYILFLKSSLTSFNGQAVMKIYIQAISKLYSVLTGKFNVIIEVEDLEEKILGLFYDMCQFLWNSGYTERAIGTFQAMLEFNIFAPALPEGTTLEDRLAFFEPFWDSGVPRVGEQGALGWDNVMAKKVISDYSTVGFAVLNEAEDAIIQSDLNRNETWLQIEKLREINHWLPWRPNADSEDCEDPERMVVVDDVVPALFPLSSEGSKLSLLFKFFDFLGVPTKQWESNQRDILAGDFSMFFGEEYSFKLPNKVELLNRVPFILRVFEQVHERFSNENKKILDSIRVSFFITHSLKLCSEKEHDLTVKHLKKFVRNILKNELNRNSIELWIEFGNLQWISGNCDEAFKVYETVFSSGGSLKTGDSLLLCFGAIAMVFGLHRRNFLTTVKATNGKEVVAKYRDKLLRYLVHVGTGDPLEHKPTSELSNVLLFRAKKGFEALISRKVDKRHSLDRINKENKVKPSSLVLATVCSASLNFLQNGLQSAIKVFEEVLQKTNEGVFSVFEHNFLFEMQFHLMKFSSTASSILRPVIIRALELNPTNVTFLELLIKLDSASYLATRRRRFFANLLSQPSVKKEAAVWVLVILSEWLQLHKVSQNLSESANLEVPQIGIAWKIRSLFEKALSMSPVTYCPLLWRMYTMFEIEQGQPDKAKTVFYKSLQKCPGHKLLYMDANLYFPTNLEESCDLMVEKQIRFRTPLEEIDLLLKHKESQ